MPGLARTPTDGLIISEAGVREIESCWRGLGVLDTRDIKCIVSHERGCSFWDVSDRLDQHDYFRDFSTRGRFGYTWSWKLRAFPDASIIILLQFAKIKSCKTIGTSPPRRGLGEFLGVRLVISSNWASVVPDSISLGPSSLLSRYRRWRPEVWRGCNNQDWLGFCEGFGTMFCWRILWWNFWSITLANWE